MIRGLLLFTACLGTPALAVDLLDVYRLARQNDTRTAAARADYRAMQERVPQARAGLVSNPAARARWTQRGGETYYLPGMITREGAPTGQLQ